MAVRELRRYQLMPVDTITRAGNFYPRDVVEKAIAQAKKPFYIHIEPVKISTPPVVDMTEVVGLCRRAEIINNHVIVDIETYPYCGLSSIWDADPDELNITFVATGVGGQYRTPDDREYWQISNYIIYSLMIANPGRQIQGSKWLKTSKIFYDPYI